MSTITNPQVTSEEGFPLEFTFRPALTADERSNFENALVLEGLWGQGLLFGGEIGREAGAGFVTREEDEAPSRPAEQERSAVERWLAGRAELSAYVIGPLSRRTITTSVRIEPIRD